MYYKYTLPARTYNTRVHDVGIKYTEGCLISTEPKKCAQKGWNGAAATRRWGENPARGVVAGIPKGVSISH